MNAISMCELQKMSAKTIAALPRAFPIQSDGRTVAILTPVHRASPERLAEIAALFAAAEARRTDEQRAAAAAILREIGET